ncbi:MAG TPA: hypothetical protein VHZ96_26195 [Frankiaceae bacterium]|nr:hypothetical protein [Frankiaceae bacterium]
MTDPLVDWWRHTLSVERWEGPGEAGADQFAAPSAVTGFYADGTKYSGGQIISTGEFAFPRDAPYVPVQSRVTLPPEFGSRVTRVVSAAVGDGGGQSTPDHQVIGLM